MGLSRIGFLKFMEFGLTMTICVLHYFSFYKEVDIVGLFITCGTYFGFALIMIGVFIGLWDGVPVNSKIVKFFTFTGAVCYAACVTLTYGKYKVSKLNPKADTGGQMGMIKVVLSLANAVAFLIDYILITFDD